LPPEPAAAVHLYGKTEVRPGRKLGHATRLLPPGALAAGHPLPFEDETP
jgi:5-(carboxyamino)imidazole ribonucleotide synthase